MKFSIKHKDSKSNARSGVLFLPRGEVRTPAFMPVGTLATVKGLTPRDINECGADIILGNTYHLMLRPGEDLVSDFGGIANFMAWYKPVLTDSGGYQVFSLAEQRKINEEGVTFRSHIDGSQHFLSPERAVLIQNKLNSDIMMALDECPAKDISKEDVEKSLILTQKWAERCIKAKQELVLSEKEDFEKNATFGREGGQDTGQNGELRNFSENGKNGHKNAIFGQGDGRRFGTEECCENGTFGSCSNGGCAEYSHKNETIGDLSGPESILNGAGRYLSAAEQSLFPIVQGGIHLDLRQKSAQGLISLNAPGYAIGGVSVGEGHELMREVVEFTAPILPEEKPRYLMGVGHPQDMLMAIAAGVDMFDCVLPTRNGRNGGALTMDGPLNMRNACHRQDKSPIEKDCDCYACQNFSKGYIRHLFIAGEMLASQLVSMHNVRFLLRLMEKARKAISDGNFASFASESIARYSEGEKSRKNDL